MVLSNGRSFDATLTDIEGGEGSAEPARSREYVFRTTDGAERRLILEYAPLERLESPRGS